MKTTTKTPTVRKNRFKKNRKRQKGLWLGRARTGLKLLLLAVILSAASSLFVMGYAALTRSDYFRTRVIAIDGNHLLTTTAVLAQAGIRKGDNLLALNLRQLRRRLQANPWIDEARVTREIPGTIAIQIQEHEPLARVDLGRKFLLDTQGRLFKEIKDNRFDFLPVVTGIAYGDINAGQGHPDPVIAMVVEVLTMSRKGKSAVAYNDIERLHLDREMGISMMLKSKQVIKLGFDHFEVKYERLRRLRPYLERNDQFHDYQTVDLNNPDRIVVQLEQAG